MPHIITDHPEGSISPSNPTSLELLAEQLTGDSQDLANRARTYGRGIDLVQLGEELTRAHVTPGQELRELVEAGIVDHNQPARPTRCSNCGGLNDPTDLDAPCRCCDERTVDRSDAGYRRPSRRPMGLATSEWEDRR